MKYRNAIGEYVHLRAENYKKYGIGRTSPDKMSLAQAYKAAKFSLMSYIKNTQTNLDLKQLEKFYNEEKIRIGVNAGLSIKTDVLDDFFISEVNKHFDAKAQKVNYNNLTVSSLGGLLQ